MQKRFEVGPAVPGDAAAAAGAHPTRHAFSCARRRASGDRARRRAGAAGPRVHQPEHADARSAVAVQRPLPRDGHECRRRQAAAGKIWPSRAGAKTAPATTGARSATCATWRAGSSGRPRISRRCKRAEQYEAIFSRGPRGVSPPRSRFRNAHRDRRLARRRHRTAPRPHHQPRRGRARTIEVTSYAEVVLAPAAADALHPAFSNLFVQTEIIARPRRHPVHAPSALARRAARRGCFT